jgi:hypothetical protein
MLLSVATIPWWAWLLCATALAMASLFAAAFAILPAGSRPGGWGCLLGTGLLVVATLLTVAMGVMRLMTALQR